MRRGLAGTTGKTVEVLDLLAPGFDTRDLKEAKVLLEELAA